MRDISSDVNPKSAISIRTVSNANAVTGDILDLQDYRAALLILVAGTIHASCTGAVVKVQHSDTNAASGMSDVPDAMLVGSEADMSIDNGSDGEVRKIGYSGDKRYVRVSVALTANAGASNYGVIAILGKPRIAPTPAIPD